MNSKVHIWNEIAKLFLDDELSKEEKKVIVQTLEESKYTKEELYCIYADEVAPIFHTNLLCAVGAWGAWSDEDLEKIKNMSYKWYHKLPLFMTFRRIIYTWSSKESWKEIENEIKKK